MNIKEAIKMCAAEANYKTCEECGVYGDSECWMYLSRFLLEGCVYCRNNKYFCVNGDEIEKIVPQFCPECGRAL